MPRWMGTEFIRPSLRIGCAMRGWSARRTTARKPAAPGALLSVLGARVESATSEDVAAPVLDASDTASQIQVPFSAKGNTVSLSLDATAGPLTFEVPLRSVSPAIFVDPEGTPLIMDAASGVLLDASKPARASSRIQVLATGFGQVKPDWPTGLQAPLKDPPRVAADGARLFGRIAGGGDASFARTGIRRVLLDRNPDPAHRQHGSRRSCIWKLKDSKAIVYGCMWSNSALFSASGVL